MLVLDHAGVSSTGQRVKGFGDVFSLRGKQYRPEVADAVGQFEYARERTEAAINLHGAALAGVFAANDGMTLGALAAVEKAGLTGKVVIVGYDFVEESRQAVDDGRLAGFIVQFPRRIAAEAFAVAIGYLRGVNTRPPRVSLVEVGIYTEEGFLDQRGNVISGF